MRVLYRFRGHAQLHTVVTYTLVEEDGEFKPLHYKDFANPQQRGALIAGTVKAAAERVAQLNWILEV